VCRRSHSRPAPPKEGRAELTSGHIPVLRDESISVLLGGVDGPDGYYADGTFGRGGHSTEILRRLSLKGRLWAFDVDPNAVAVGRKLMDMDDRFSMIHRPFADVNEAIPHDVELSGMLLDIGFSSPQVDDGARGWSCYQDGPLDLRMNFKVGVPAAKWLLTATVAEISWVLRENGEDDDPYLCKRIAESMLERQRRCGPYTSTLQLSACVCEVKRGIDDRGQHPAKLAFQGIRNFINQEMEQLAAALEGQFKRLKFGGRAVIITFKPREEAVVQEFLRQNEDGWRTSFGKRLEPGRLAQLYPLLQRPQQPYAVRRICQCLRPSHSEVERNTRCRSAMVHVLVKEQRCSAPPGVDAITVQTPEAHPALKRLSPPPLAPMRLPDPDPAEIPTPFATRMCTAVITGGEGDAAAGLAKNAQVDGNNMFVLRKTKDWVCECCGEVVFGRRITCRLCGAPRP